MVDYNIINDLKDICLELIDEKFEINVGTNDYHAGYCNLAELVSTNKWVDPGRLKLQYNVRIQKQNGDEFLVKDCREVILRMKDYMSGFKILGDQYPLFIFESIVRTLRKKDPDLYFKNYTWHTTTKTYHENWWRFFTFKRKIEKTSKMVIYFTEKL